MNEPSLHYIYPSEIANKLLQHSYESRIDHFVVCIVSSYLNKETGFTPLMGCNIIIFVSCKHRPLL